MLLILVLSLAATAAIADPTLLWSPSNTLISEGEQTELSVHLPTSDDVRTIELTVAYDPEVVTSVSIVPGDLFAGFTNFTDFYETEPGRWTGYCVVLGADDWATGPGELVRWTVAGVDTGVTAIATVDLSLVPPGGGDYLEAELIDDQIRVDVPVGVPATAPLLPQLSLYPNPFNPRTRVELLLPGGGQARLEVLDVRGRVVAMPWRGTAAADHPVLVDWTGADVGGQPLPSGVYVFRLVSAAGPSAQRQGTLVR
jgi:hypothetical protein